MTDTLYENFSDPTNEFSKEPRAFCYDLASQFIDKARKAAKSDWLEDTNTIKAVLLLLFTWNFAARETKQLDFSKVAALLREAKPDLQFLDCYRITDNLPDEAWDRIQATFDKFKPICGQTGASKALSLLNPHLFVMWDTEIRRRLGKQLIRGIGNGETGAKYVVFLKGVQKIIREYQIEEKLPSGSNVAKKFDEYNYVRIVMQRRA
jgi:hypothetical protein